LRQLFWLDVEDTGSVVFDRYGFLVDDTGFDGTGKGIWLSALSTQSWPGLAGQTIPYVCEWE
jgi:hypothetical protein